MLPFRSIISCVLFISSTVAISAPLIPVCEKNRDALWKIIIKGDKATLEAPKGEEEWGEEYSFLWTQVNDDAVKDLNLEMGACGTGGCMNALFAGCGDGQHYLAASPPDYRDPYLDKAHFALIDGTKWYDITYPEEFSKDDDGNITTVGWRLRFNGREYELAFLPKELAMLVKNAKAGKDWALYQLSKEVYPLMARRPGDPSLSAVKDDLMNPSLIKRALSVWSANITEFPPEVRKNRGYTLIAVAHENILNFGQLEPAFLRDPEIARVTLREHGDTLKFFSPEIRGNRQLVELAIKQEAYSLEYAADSIRSDKALMMEWSKKFHISADNLPAFLKKDKEVAKAFVANDSESYRFFDESIRADRDIAHDAMAKSGSASVPYLPDTLRNDPELLLYAAKNDWQVAKLIPGNLLKNRNFAGRLLCASQDSFEYLPEIMRMDRSLALIAAIRYPSNYAKASPALQNDRTFALQVARFDPWVYQDLPDSLRADKEIARAVFQQISLQWNTAPDSIKKDADVSALVKKAPESDSTKIQVQETVELSRLCAIEAKTPI